jgi:methyl-accepting chemotaxis protein
MTTKKELIDKIERTADELIDYMDGLRSEVEDVVDEARDTDTTLERLQEIKQALSRVTDEQEQGLNI